MQNIIKTEDPKYYLERGDKLYLAVDNAHGGATIVATVTGLTVQQPGNRNGYHIKYQNNMPPYDTVEDVALADEVFTSLEDVAKARTKDNSVQMRKIAEICATPTGLVHHLLAHTELTGADYEAVVNAAKALDLY